MFVFVGVVVVGVVVGVVVVGVVVVAGVAVPVVVWAPPPTEPFAASCSWMYCLSSGEMLFAVQPLLFPPPAPIERTLIETPQMFAAILIGICALIGMFALSMCRSPEDWRLVANKVLQE